MTTGYNIREGSAMIAERAALPDLMLPDRVLVNGVTFQFSVPHELGSNSRYDTVALGSIDRHGHVSIDTPKRWDDDEGEWRANEHERWNRAASYLQEAGLAEWRSVGSGDSELYATAALLKLVQPALAALPDGWQTWPS